MTTFVLRKLREWRASFMRGWNRGWLVLEPRIRPAQETDPRE